MVIMHLVSTVTGHAYPVELWEKYGVVCPSLYTTNGSGAYMARVIADWINAGYCRVENSKLEGDIDYWNKEPIIAALRPFVEKQEHQWRENPE